jgi:RNA polymerase sigma-70 factor (ECF subfamily)
MDTQIETEQEFQKFQKKLFFEILFGLDPGVHIVYKIQPNSPLSGLQHLFEVSGQRAFQDIAMTSIALYSPFTFATRETSTRENSEAHLIDRCRAGDVDAFNELMASHQDRVYRICLWYLRDMEAALDAAQETFISAFRGLKSFRGDCVFSTWLHRIAVNVVKKHIQRNRRTPLPISTLETDDSTFPELPASGTDPGVALVKHTRRQAVHKALAALPTHHRTVLELFDIQGHTYEEVAQALGVPIGTVKSRLNRARLALRVQLEPQLGLFED